MSQATCTWPWDNTTASRTRKRTRTKRPLYNEESWQAGRHTPNTGISSKATLPSAWRDRCTTPVCCQLWHMVQRPGAKTIKKNTNSTQNKSETHRAKQYEVTSFLSTDCELSTETCSKNEWQPLLITIRGLLNASKEKNIHNLKSAGKRCLKRRALCKEGYHWSRGISRDYRERLWFNSDWKTSRKEPKWASLFSVGFLGTNYAAPPGGFWCTYIWGHSSVT